MMKPATVISSCGVISSPTVESAPSHSNAHRSNVYHQYCPRTSLAMVVARGRPSSSYPSVNFGWPVLDLGCKHVVWLFLLLQLVYFCVKNGYQHVLQFPLQHQQNCGVVLSSLQYGCTSYASRKCGLRMQREEENLVVSVWLPHLQGH